MYGISLTVAGWVLYMFPYSQATNALENYFLLLAKSFGLWFAINISILWLFTIVCIGFQYAGPVLQNHRIWGFPQTHREWAWKCLIVVLTATAASTAVYTFGFFSPFLRFIDT